MHRKLKNNELGRLTQEEFKNAGKINVTVVLDNIRSQHNIGAAFRTSDSFLIEKIILCGCCATPPTAEIHKSALGAEFSVDWLYTKETTDAIASLKEAWLAAKSQAALASNTNERIERLFRDSVVTLQRKEEANALAKTAMAAEEAARYQYEMAQEGARQEDKGAARAMVSAAQGSVDEVGALLKDSHLTAPANGVISEIYPTVGELVMPGAAIMELQVLDESHAVFNIREDLLEDFLPGKEFHGTIPALGNARLKFRVYYNSPLGSYATWQSSRESGSYDLVTFKVKAVPVEENSIATELRPGMSVIVHYRGK